MEIITQNTSVWKNKENWNIKTLRKVPISNKMGRETEMIKCRKIIKWNWKGKEESGKTYFHKYDLPW